MGAKRTLQPKWDGQPEQCVENEWRVDWKQSEISKAVQLLEVSENEISAYFFTSQVRCFEPQPPCTDGRKEMREGVRQDVTLSDKKLTEQEFSKKYWKDGRFPYQYMQFRLETEGGHISSMMLMVTNVSTSTRTELSNTTPPARTWGILDGALSMPWTLAGI